MPLLVPNTAAPASSMPAPQVSMVQRHSSWSMGLPELSNCGAVHGSTGEAGVASALVVGNGRAVACSMTLTCTGVSAGCTESINPIVALTSGAEKLVPKDGLKLSV